MKILNKFEEIIFLIIMVISTILVILPLVLIISIILIKGIPSFNLKMIFTLPKGGFYMGNSGGIFNAVAGSFIIAGTSSIIAALLSIPVIIYLNIYKKSNSFFSNTIRFLLEILTGIPSIVYGAFGLIIMQMFIMKASLICGIITVTVLIFPIICRSMDEAARDIDNNLLESSYSLGATKLETGIKILLRQILPGLITGFLLGFGRGIGDSASVLFTAGYTDNLPASLTRPAATLPLAIFFQLNSPFKEVQNRAYASAIVLTIIILLISIIARLTSKCFETYRKN